MANTKRWNFDDALQKLFDEITGHFKVDASIVGSLPNQTLAEQLIQTDAGAGILTFAANIGAIGIYNTDAANAGVFVVNGINIHVPAGKYVEFVVGGTPAATVTITGATTYIVSRLV